MQGGLPQACDWSLTEAALSRRGPGSAV